MEERGITPLYKLSERTYNRDREERTITKPRRNETMYRIDTPRDELESEIERLNGELTKIRNAFMHVHENNESDDTCKKCGLDLRNPIHERWYHCDTNA